MTDWALAQHRQQAIYQRLLTAQGCTTRALAAWFGTSTMTIRRDLEVLERQGLLQRVHGGAVIAHNDLPYLTRHEQFSVQKDAIGVQAAKLVQDGMTVFFDSGTTSMAVARALMGRSDLSFTVVTHALNVAYLFTLPKRQRVIVIGGEVYENSLGTASSTAIQQLGELNYDLFFMGTCGVDVKAGLTNTNVPEAHLKQEVHARSARTILIADHHKWPLRALAPILPLSAVGTWVSDAGLPAPAREYAASLGVEVITAPPAKETSA